MERRRGHVAPSPSERAGLRSPLGGRTRPGLKLSKAVAPLRPPPSIPTWEARRGIIQWSLKAMGGGKGRERFLATVQECKKA